MINHQIHVRVTQSIDATIAGAEKNDNLTSRDLTVAMRTVGTNSAPPDKGLPDRRIKAPRAQHVTAVTHERHEHCANERGSRCVLDCTSLLALHCSHTIYTKIPEDTNV
jgi:hypothetical protein